MHTVGRRLYCAPLINTLYPMTKETPNTIPPQTEEKEMSFWDHLEVLRWAIFRVLGLFTVFFVIMLWLMPRIFSTFVLGPTSGQFFVYRWLNKWTHGIFGFDPNFHVQIININVTSQFLTHINTSLAFAGVMTFPFLVYEIWKYIKPALYSNEIRNVRKAFFGGTLMFYLGCAMGYLLVFPFTFRFLVEYNLSSEIINQINLQSYINNFTMLILIMGIVFEMPLLAWLLSAMGVLHRQFLQTYRRHAVVILLVLAAFITPSGDPFTLMLVFVPLYLLFELSVVVVKPKKKGV